MAKSKQLTPEQKNFLSQFLVKGTRAEEKKLTEQYRDFLRRKTKILADVFKLPAGNPTRKALEDQIGQIDQSMNQNGQANIKGAYESLAAMKKQARNAAQGLAPLTAADVERRIDHLSRSGFRRVSQANEALGKVDVLCAELRKPENQAATKPTLPRAVGFLTDFQGVEDQLRTDLANAANIKTAVAQDVDQFPLAEKTQDIRNEIALLKEISPGAAGHLPALLDKALMSFQMNGAPLTGKAIAHAFEVKVTEFESLLKACKDISKFQVTAQQNVPDELKHLARRDKKRRAMARRQVKGEGLSDKAVLNVTKPDPKKVDLPYQWDLVPEYQDFADDLPGSLSDITPELTQQCMSSAKKLIKDLFTAKANDADFLFDLSVQTRESLEALVGQRLDLQIPPPDPKVLASRDVRKAAEPWTLVERYLSAKDRYQQDSNASAYATVLEAVAKRCKLGLKAGNTTNPAVKKIYEDLKAAIDQELPTLAKAKPFIESVANEMLAAINEHAPHQASQQTTQFQITVAGGQPQPFDIPSEITFKNVKYKVKDFLGAGAMGATFRYEDPKGNILVLKGNLDPDEKKTDAFAQEIKMHNHLMGGGDADKKHVLKMEGAVRGPDGKLYMLMENAGGGNMDRLGQNVRALGASGVLSQEALNALNQHLVRQAVKGLKYLQNRNMTHHDIKADNYFLGSDGTVKLADFGSTQVADNPDGEVPNSDDIEGAKDLRAPEFKAKAALSPILTPKADTYTLGVLISMLTSPNEASGQDDFKSPRLLTALDRLKNAMLDQDPTKRPTIEAVEYSAYLDDEVDSQLAQALLKASMDYSKKAGKEVADKQGEVNYLQGLLHKGKEKSAPLDDAALTAKLKPGEDVAALIRGQLAKATANRDFLVGAVAGLKQNPNDPIGISNANQNGACPMMHALNNAEGYYRLANLNDNGLRQEIADLKAIVLRTNTEFLKFVDDQVAGLRQQIAAINARPDIKPLVDQVKQAQDALLRGPETQPGKEAPTPEAKEKAILLRKQKLSKLVESLIGKDTAKTWPYVDDLESAEDYAILEQFDQANAILDTIEKDLHKHGGLKLFETQMKEAITQVQAIADPTAKTNLEKLLRESMALATKRDLDGAYERYQQVARHLRNLDIEKELPTA